MVAKPVRAWPSSASASPASLRDLSHRRTRPSSLGRRRRPRPIPLPTADLHDTCGSSCVAALAGGLTLGIRSGDIPQVTDAARWRRAGRPRRAACRCDSFGDPSIAYFGAMTAVANSRSRWECRRWPAGAPAISSNAVFCRRNGHDDRPPHVLVARYPFGASACSRSRRACSTGRSADRCGLLQPTLSGAAARAASRCSVGCQHRVDPHGRSCSRKRIGRGRRRRPRDDGRVRRCEGRATAGDWRWRRRPGVGPVAHFNTIAPTRTVSGRVLKLDAQRC